MTDPLGAAGCHGPPLPLSAHAFSFGDPDGVHGSFDTIVSQFAAGARKTRDPTLIQGRQRQPAAAFRINTDDGDLNCSKNKIISSLLKVNHDLDPSHSNSGLFARAFLRFSRIRPPHRPRTDRQ